VQDLGNGNGLLTTLKNRLGFNINKLENGILWTMFFNQEQNAKNIAIKITKELLINENYQKFKIFRQ